MEELNYCYTPEQMAAFVEGFVSPTEMLAFERHMVKCEHCRREWTQVSLARNLLPENPPLAVQELIYSAPRKKRPLRKPYNVRHSYGSRQKYKGMRVASLLAAILLIAVVFALISAHNNDNHFKVDTDSQQATYKNTNDQKKIEQDNMLAEPIEKDIIKKPKVENAPMPELEKKVDLAQTPQPVIPEKLPEEEIKPDRIAKPEQVVKNPEPRIEKHEKIAKKPEQDSALDSLKKKPENEKENIPRKELAIKLTKDDANLFKKEYRKTLIAMITKEQELIKEAQNQAKKFDPILGRPIQPGAPVAPQKSKPEPKAEPENEPPPNPNAPPPLPRIDKLRKEGKIPQEESKPPEEGTNPDVPPPLPRIEELRKKGKLPPAKPENDSQPKQGDPAEDPAKKDPSPAPKPSPQPSVPRQPGPAGPVKRGMATLPEVNEEHLAKLAKAAGFKPLKVPNLKKGIILASAELIQDTSKDNVVHLFYYQGKSGFSLFERKSERTDKEVAYQVHYNGKNKTRSLMWAVGGREFIVVAQKLSKRQMLAIEASVRDLFE